MISLLIYFIFVVGPVIFWFWFFHWEDRAEPEPKKTLFLILGIGMMLAVFGGFLETTIFSIFFPGFQKELSFQSNQPLPFSIVVMLALGSIIEELLKYFSLKEYAYSKIDFNQVADGVFYGVTLALGFAFIENTLYFFQFLQLKQSELISAALFRGILTTMMHITSAGLIGYSLGKKKFSEGHSNRLILIFLFLAILLHITFNVFIAVIDPVISILVLAPTILLVFFFLIKVINKPENQLVWRLVTPQKPAKNPIPTSAA